MKPTLEQMREQMIQQVRHDTPEVVKKRNQVVRYFDDTMYEDKEEHE